MATCTFTIADPIAQRDTLIAINVEYMSWVAGEIERAFGISQQVLAGMEVADYVAGVLDKVVGEAPPRGVFYLVHVDGELAGMGGLRNSGDGVAEIKRFYVRPACRGLQLGQQLLQRLLADAETFGYRCVRLDTAPFMQAAQRLYAAAGFVGRGPYEGTEVPPALHTVWRFMERPL